MKYWIRLSFGLALLFWGAQARATNYLFHVSCENKILVVEWDTGSVDPGKEYLRVATGTKYPNCGVADYDEALDKSLARERYSHEGGIIAGIPFVGGIICGWFGC
jgi:hypothetical protein